MEIWVMYRVTIGFFFSKFVQGFFFRVAKFFLGKNVFFSKTRFFWPFFARAARFFLGFFFIFPYVKIDFF